MDKRMITKEERIMKSCAKAISLSGFKKASILDICKGAGVAKGLVYYYFENKEKLFFETYKFYVDKLKSYIDMDFANITDIFDLVEKSVREKTIFFKDYPEAKEFLNLSLKSDNKDIQEFIRKSTDDTYAKMFKQVDMTLFKDNVDISSVLKMVGLIGQALINQVDSDTNIDEMMSEYHIYLSIIKKSVYKEDK
jgi:AcrR family transcriptional regulator